MSDLSQLNSFESIIQALELVSPGPGKQPGTRLQRLLIDQALADAYQLGNPPGQATWPATPVRAWCLALGRLGHPHNRIYYGWDIGSCVSKAVKELICGQVRA